MDATITRIDPAPRLLTLTANLIAALEANDVDRAFRLARSLRTTADSIVLQLGPKYLGTDAEISEALHG